MSLHTIKTANNINHLMHHFFDDVFVNSNGSKRIPVNAIENDNAYQLEIAALGFDKKNLHIKVEDGVLYVNGNITDTSSNKQETYHINEFTLQSFERKFSIPDSVDSKLIDADYQNGILTVTLPKKEEAKPQAPIQIDIK